MNEQLNQESAQYMAENVYGPTFFAKLASYGIQPGNETEAERLLEIGAMLEHVDNEDMQKTAAADPGTAFLDFAATNLQQAVVGGKPQLDPQAKLAALAYASSMDE